MDKQKTEWLETMRLKEYSKFKVKKLSPEDFSTYFGIMFMHSGVAKSGGEKSEQWVLFEADEGVLIRNLYRFWVVLIVPSLALSLQLLYFMVRDAPDNEGPEHDPSAKDSEGQQVKGQYHSFEDADQSIRFAKWLDQFASLGVIGNENEKEVRGVYHFLDQCKIKLGYDYIQVSKGPTCITD